MSKKTKRINVLIIFMCLVTLISFSFFNINVKADDNANYTIEYELNGGENDPSNPSTYDGSKDITLKDPTKTGYTFKGWELTLDEGGHKYKAVEYLQSNSGKQYINTGIIPTSTVKSEIVFNYYNNLTSNHERLVFGSCDKYGGNYYNYYIGKQKTGNPIFIGVGFWEHTTYFMDDGKKHTVTLIPGNSNPSSCKYILDDSGEKAITNSYWRDTFSNSPILLFAISMQGSPSCYSQVNIYSFKVWDNKILKRDMIPVIEVKSDETTGACGMYDIVNKKFYGNANTSPTTAPFVAGEEKTVSTSIINKGSIGNRTFTAKWEANKYNVTLDSQGGTGGDNSVQVTYDADIPSITVPTRDKYLFKGYYDQATGGTKYINYDGTSAKKWDKTSNTTLYAQWEEITVTPSKTSSSVAIGCTDTISFTFNPSSIGSTAVFQPEDENIVTVSYTNNVLTITGVSKGETTIKVFADETSKGKATAVLATIDVDVKEKPQPIIDPGDMPYDETNGFKAKFNKGVSNTATAHISGASKEDLGPVTNNGVALNKGTDYTVEDGSIKVIFQPSYLNKLSYGTHVLNINVKNNNYKVTIIVDDPSKPVPSPGKDESCEKVIGPTWHWNNKKGICEDASSVSTHVR